jgi:N-acetylglutamate synthase-like GNAT family acetyltransferase
MNERIKELVKGSGLSVEDIDKYEADWVVENQDGEIIGYTGVEKRGGNVYLESLSVKNEYRRCGIGRRLVEKAYNYINEGDTLIALTLFWNNDFYRKCGFTMLNAKETKGNDDISSRSKHKYCVAWGKEK